MLKKYIIILGFALCASIVNADTKKRVIASESSGSGEVPLAYTHLAPSTAVIPGETFVIGTSVGFGFFDLFDLSSNLVLDVQGVFNVGTKIAIYHDHNFAFAPFVTFTTQSLTETDQFGNQTSLTSTSWDPGATFSYRILPDLTGHSSFTYVSRNPTIPKSTVQNPRTALIEGNTANQDFTVGITGSVALSMGASYDFTYDIVGAGASFHFSNFKLGAHYYFNVGQGNFLPIIGGGYSGSF